MRRENTRLGARKGKALFEEDEEEGAKGDRGLSKDRKDCIQHDFEEEEV